MNESSFNPVTDTIVDELRDIVGPSYVVYGDADKLQPYSHDEIPDRHYAHMPDVLARPRTAEDIAAVMKLANRDRIAVTPRGAGSGLSGGAVPIHGGIVLLCDRMNEILEVDEANMMLVAEPGVVTAEINERLAGTGLFYAGYPMSLETCSLGGNVAENAGGGKAVKYGVTSRYVLGLEVVTPTGEIVQLGGKLIKDVTGYSLVPLMLGSEGTLGIFTKITLKLSPAPRSSVDLLALFKTAEDAIAAVPTIMTEGGIVPTAIEFIDRNAVKLACDYLNETLPYQDAGAMLLLTCDGPTTEQVEREYEAIGEQCLAAGGIEVYVADNATTTERIWSVRRNIAEAAALLGEHQANEDLVVPPAAIAELVLGLEAISRKHDVFMPAYGHAGDGNIHTRIIKRPETSIEDWQAALPGVLREVYTLTARLGGRISGEHGIGHKRKAHMGQFVSEAYLDLCRSLKKAWDPNGVLNPGKIFDL
ncbi:MAG: FAD-binding protein [Planctomycetes bacterium]|jgi:glycolate oxidase|nr:FAD-binding protein [Phycisphaerae bacterium]NBB94683.1 FAD-binding protein [Planctomycetota bacterium]